MGQFIDLTGKQFGRLAVIERAENDGKRVMWRCLCDCGKEIITRGDNLRDGKSTSCGCFTIEQAIKATQKHGEYNTRLYRIWIKTKVRCYNTKDKRYKDYGGRGITVCEEWRNDFNAFYDWAMANGYQDNLTIDRIDVNGNYEPSNCRWITNQEQQHNKRDNHYITFEGATHTITEWARIKGLSENGLVHRMRQGWSVERALTEPMHRKRL